MAYRSIELPLETNAQVLFQLENSVPGMMWASQVAVGHECSVSIRVFGTEGALEWNHDTPGQLRVTKIGGPTQIYTPGREYLYPNAAAMTRLPYGHPEGFYETFANIYRDFIRHILARRECVTYHPLYPTIGDGVHGLRFVEACLQSAAENNIWITI